MAIQIPQHVHCVMCGKAIPTGEKVCGPACQANLDVQNKRRKNMMLMIYGAMALSMGLLILNAFGIVR
jgi:predicted nucleic acid-binding Zn ribbon protein